MNVNLEELTPQERELLRAARSNGGQLAVFARPETHGAAVRTKLKAFYHPRDRQVAKQYVGALHHLVDLQLLRPHAREEFELTNHGWEVGRKV